MSAPEGRRDVKSGIEYYRKTKGLTQARVAEALGTTEQRMGRIEAGQEIPTAAEVDKLVALLETPPTYLFSKHILNEVAERARASSAA
jgi:transcriptional regulator with XRE-family HTH domain